MARSFEVSLDDLLNIYSEARIDSATDKTLEWMDAPTWDDVYITLSVEDERGWSRHANL